MNAAATIPATREKYGVQSSRRSLTRFRLQTAALIGCGVAAAIGAHQLGIVLGSTLAHHFFTALIGTSVFLYVPIALERDYFGLIGNLMSGGLVFALAVVALHQPTLFIARVFLAQGVWSGWVAGLCQAESDRSDLLWTWSVFNLTLAALI